MLPELTRRGLGGLLLGAASGLTLVGSEPATAATVLGEPERQAFRALVDTLMPDGEGSLGAVAIGVDEAILAKASRIDGLSELIADAATWLDAQAHAAGAAAFATLDSNGRERIVAILADMPRDTPAAWSFVVTLGQVYRHYYAHPGSWAAIGYAGPPQPIGFPDYAEPPVALQ
jgi:hypothetical protein